MGGSVGDGLAGGQLFDGGLAFTFVLYTYVFKSIFFFFFKPLWKLLFDMVSKLFNIITVSVNEMDFMNYLSFDNQSIYSGLSMDHCSDDKAEHQ